MNKVTSDWETIVEDTQNANANWGTERLKIFGGWLVKNWQLIGREGMVMNTVFVPDSNHEWKL